jgi:toxin YoeB
VPNRDPRERFSHRRAELHPQFREDLTQWIRVDSRVALRIMQLLEATVRDPFGGIGKPEALRFDKGGYWSRRITLEDRMVYKVEGDRVIFAACRGHYAS